MMVHLRESAEPMTQEEFDIKLEEHHKFINSGGAGGSWQTFVTEGGMKKGLILGIYLGAKGSEGEQLKLSHKNLEKLQLKNISLTYADLVGVLCRNQNFKNTDLTGSLSTDSDYSGSNFEKANLSNADLEDVDLTGSDLRGAILDRTMFKNTVLKDVISDCGITASDP